MVGIGGGVPSAKSELQLGDVVTSQPHLQHGGVVQYDLGKTGAGGHYTRTGLLNTPPTGLLNALSKLQSNYLLGRSNLSTYLSSISHLPSRREYERLEAEGLNPFTSYGCSGAEVGGNSPVDRANTLAHHLPRGMP